MFQKSLSGWRMLPRILASLLAGLALTQPLLAHADETEVFRADNENGNTRPKVLIIFDNSGSMGSLAQRKPAYNPAITYDPVPGIEDGRLYWASGNPVRPPAVDTNNWFPASVNRCVSSTTRTESRDDVFYAMFRPTTGVNWPGNIKKLKVRVAANGSAALVDSAGNEAIDSQTGFIKESAVTFWGSNPDGPAVSSGGVGARLAARDPDGRVIKTNTGTNGALQDFNITNINRDAYSLTTDAQLHSLFDAGSANELADLIAWARGWTDRNKTARRDWILGDIVHSRPLVLNYGARTSDFSASNPDLRVVVGTNAGFLHMFDTANGNENWAFFPKELTKIFKARKDDVLGGNKVWGVDAPVVSYRFDANQDGSIKAVDGDKMYIVFGLRRGGRALYAMDVTDPDNPSFLWRIGPDTAGFSELGQTWSVPVVTNVPGYVVGGVRRPVLVFGAGYDSVNDDITRTAAETVDTVGRGLFVVDVATGALVWSVTPAADSATNKREPGFVHAMAAPPSVIDSNGDGIADRVYMPDVGGNVWRIDMPGNTRPTAATEQNRWRVTKLASLANVALLNPARQAGGDTHASPDPSDFRTVCCRPGGSCGERPGYRP